MAWGGDEAWRDRVAQWWLEYEIGRLRHAVWQAGVLHGDVAARNVLWSKELRRAVIIDFVYSRLLKEYWSSGKLARQLVNIGRSSDNSGDAFIVQL